MAPDGNIYFHPDSNDYYDDYSLAGATVQHTFIHELVHVWQHQHGINVRKAAMSGYDYWPMKRDRSFSSYNLEQQAQMVADYFMLKEHGLMWKSLSNQNPAPKAQDYERIIPFEYKK